MCKERRYEPIQKSTYRQGTKPDAAVLHVKPTQTDRSHAACRRFAKRISYNAYAEYTCYECRREFRRLFQIYKYVSSFRAIGSILDSKKMRTKEKLTILEVDCR